MPTINKRVEELEKRSSTDETVEIRVIWDEAELERENPNVFIVEWDDDENDKQTN